MTKTESLISREQAEIEAAPLFSFINETLKIDRQKPRWNCTGEYLKKHRPDIYDAALTMLCEPGVSIRMICRTLHVSHNTLASIQEREAVNLDTRKKGILKTVTRGLRLCAERVEELAPEMQARDAIIGVGVLTEKMELLGGQPTARIEVASGPDIFEELQKLHDEAKAQFEEMKRARATEIGMDGKNLEQKALMDCDHEQPCDAENGARNVVVDMGATSIVAEPGSNAGEAI